MIYVILAQPVTRARICPQPAPSFAEWAMLAHNIPQPQAWFLD
jgi:hypothetical protein